MQSVLYGTFWEGTCLKTSQQTSKAWSASRTTPALVLMCKLAILKDCATFSSTKPQERLLTSRWVDALVCQSWKRRLPTDNSSNLTGAGTKGVNRMETIDRATETTSRAEAHMVVSLSEATKVTGLPATKAKEEAAAAKATQAQENSELAYEVLCHLINSKILH